MSEGGGEKVEQLLLEEFEPSIEYIDIVHKNSKGWITKADIQNGYRQWHYKYKELIELDFNKENIYISLNTFYSTFRRLEYIKELQANFIDIDCYNSKYTKEAVLYFLENDLYGYKIPRPSLIIDSGRGLYLIWLIEAVPNKALPLWKAVQEYLYRQLKEFGADRQALDATRVLRVVGSVNSKTGTRVQILDRYDYIYKLREIQSEYLPELEPNRPKKKGRPSKVVFVHRERSLYYARIQDITKLCELRDYDVKGHRELILFLYRYYLCSFYDDAEKALNDVLELNSQFIKPLPINEATKATGSAEKVYLSKDKQYKYKNETLIDLLCITEEEETYMTTIISKREYKRRKNLRNSKAYKEKLKSEGKLSKKEEMEQIREKIKSLREEGLKNKEISKALSLTTKTLERHITYMRKNGLL